MTMMIDGPADVKAMETESAVTTTEPCMEIVAEKFDRRYYSRTMMMDVVVRLSCFLASVAALCFMATAKETAVISVFGFGLPVHSKWSFSTSFEYVVGISTVVAAHSLLQLVINAWRLLRKTTVNPSSRNHAWLLFAVDQAFTMAMISAGSAASGVTNLNHAGIKHTALPNFCKPLRRFCNHVAVSIAFTFVGCFFLLVSTVLDVIWLSRN
ncbi:CASP-like protein 3A1 [Impatiens glandulifera]|uniref:CASP-like protein 3A1 n=1 Tax=Impatiens glandulifera TaxID=253017 RepID=UPI001FB1687F|nr:CASP-like protein 3A1 [Impatiens glandulifera]